MNNIAILAIYIVIYSGEFLTLVNPLPSNIKRWHWQRLAQRTHTAGYDEVIPNAGDDV